MTIDDVPFSGDHADPRVAELNSRVLIALRDRAITAVGFVVCSAGHRHPGTLKAWISQGHALGNHTNTHVDLHGTRLSEWVTDVARCRDSLRGQGGSNYFRFPFLHEGSSELMRREAAAALAQLSYRVAPVTIDNSEWIVADLYRRTAVEDTAERRQLAAAYIAHMRRAASHARAIARGRFGREVPQILLVHLNELNADWLGPLLDSLRTDGARYVTLEAALSDSIYDRATDYVGEKGLSWLYQVQPSQPQLALWDDEEAHELSTPVHVLGVPSAMRDIERRSAAFSAAYLRGDAAEVRSFYTEDAILILPGGRTVTRGDAIERYWTVGPQVHVLEHRMRTERLSGDGSRVIEVGRWFTTSKRGLAEPVSASGRYVAVWVRADGGEWRMEVDTWHRDDGRER